MVTIYYWSETICSWEVAHEYGQLPKIWTNNYNGSGMLLDPSAHPQNMNGLKHLICFEWIWKPFHVGLGPQPMLHDIICTVHLNQEFGQLPIIWADGCGGVVNPSAHPQHMNDRKHLVYIWSGYGNHSMWIWGLNKCSMTSFVAHLWTRIRPTS